MGISKNHLAALKMFPPVTLLEPKMDFFEFMSRHADDLKKDTVIENTKLLDDFYEHCIEHSEKTHLKKQKPLLKKILEESLKKLHSIGFLFLEAGVSRNIKWDLISDFYDLLRHIRKSDERKIRWALFYWFSTRGKKKSFSDFEKTIKDLKISNIQKIIKKVTKTRTTALEGFFETDLWDIGFTSNGKSLFQAYVEDLEFTSRRSPGELDDDILDLLDMGSYSNQEISRILDASKALVSKSMTRLKESNEISFASYGTRGSNYFTTNCNNCPFGKDKFSCRKEAISSITELLKNYGLSLPENFFDSVETNQALLRIKQIFTEATKHQTTKMEQNINENLDKIFLSIMYSQSVKDISTHGKEIPYARLENILRNLPSIYSIGFVHGQYGGGNLAMDLVGKALKGKISKRAEEKMLKDLFKEVNKMSSILTS